MDQNLNFFLGLSALDPAANTGRTGHLGFLRLVPDCENSILDFRQLRLLRILVGRRRDLRLDEYAVVLGDMQPYQLYPQIEISLFLMFRRLDAVNSSPVNTICLICVLPALLVQISSDIHPSYLTVGRSDH
jgi:hypothetical protein